MADLLGRCWSTNTEERPTAEDLMEYLAKELQECGAGHVSKSQIPSLLESPAEPQMEDVLCESTSDLLSLAASQPSLSGSCAEEQIPLTGQRRRLCHPITPHPIVKAQLRVWKKLDFEDCHELDENQQRRSCSHLKDC